MLSFERFSKSLSVLKMEFFKDLQKIQRLEIKSLPKLEKSHKEKLKKVLLGNLQFAEFVRL